MAGIIKKSNFGRTVKVNGTKTLEQLVAEGKYVLVGSDIKQSNFPIINTTLRTITIEFFCITCDMTSKDIIHEMKRVGYKPITIEELLTLGVDEPELQEKFTILGLGSIHNECVPALYFDDGVDRAIDEGVPGPKWLSNTPSKCLFAAIRIHNRVFKRKKVI